MKGWNREGITIIAKTEQDNLHYRDLPKSTDLVFKSVNQACKEIKGAYPRGIAKACKTGEMFAGYYWRKYESVPTSIRKANNRKANLFNHMQGSLSIEFIDGIPYLKMKDIRLAKDEYYAFKNELS